jgi:hypothetical protein
VTQVEALAKYAARASFADLSAQSRQQLPVHILDSLGCCIAALGAGPVEACRAQAVISYLRRRPRRKDRPRCGAKTRAGRPCRMRVEFGKARCRLHGGLSTRPLQSSWGFREHPLFVPYERQSGKLVLGLSLSDSETHSGLSSTSANPLPRYIPAPNRTAIPSV